MTLPSPSFSSIPCNVLSDVAAPGKWPLKLEDRVRRLRSVILAGTCTQFVPYDDRYAEVLRNMRNAPENRRWLAQDDEITAVMQARWAEAYRRRVDDLCWILEAPDGTFAGSVSLYDISPCSAETGRLVLDPQLARTTPLFLEVEFLLQQVAGRWLGLPEITARVQKTNEKVIAMHNRVGFVHTGEASFRGRPYVHLSVALPHTISPIARRLLMRAKTRAAASLRPPPPPS